MFDNFPPFNSANLPQHPRFIPSFSPSALPWGSWKHLGSQSVREAGFCGNSTQQLGISYPINPSMLLPVPSQPLNQHNPSLSVPLFHGHQKSRSERGEMHQRTTVRRSAPGKGIHSIRKDKIVTDNFRVTKLIGKGSFGFVFKAYSRKDQKPNDRKTPYAVKSFKAFAILDRVEAEIEALRNFGNESKNVIEMLCSFRSLDKIYIVTNFIDSVNFVDLIDDIGYEEMLEYMINLLIALEYLHSEGVIHRDVKSGNFLYDRKTKTYRLIDFGLAEEKKGMKVAPLTHSPSQSSNSSRKRQSAESEDNSRKKSLRMDLFNAKKDFKSKAQAGCQSGDLSNIFTSTTVPETIDLAETDENNGSKSLSCKVVGASSQSLRLVPNKPCSCFGKNKICRPCGRRPKLKVNQSGTPGYRAPEILLKYTKQGPPCDVWAAGIIFGSLLSSKYPFFLRKDHFESLRELTAFVGRKRMADGAEDMKVERSLHIQFTTSFDYPGVDVRRFMEIWRLRWFPTERSKCNLCRTLIEVPQSRFCICKLPSGWRPSLKVSREKCRKDETGSAIDRLEGIEEATYKLFEAMLEPSPAKRLPAWKAKERFQSLLIESQALANSESPCSTY